MSSGRPRDAGDFVHGINGPVVILSARVAAVLERHANLDAFRRQARGTDPEVDVALAALHEVALRWRSAELTSAEATALVPTNGTPVAAAPEQPAELLTTDQASRRSGISPRGITQAIHRHRLPAQKENGRWLISPTDLAIYQSRKNPP